MAYIAVAYVVCFAASALASDSVARRFVGVNIDGPALQPATGIRGQLRSVARAGAGTVRWTIDWPLLQPYRVWSDVPLSSRKHLRNAGGLPIDFRSTDRFVAAAARARLEPLPVVIGAARWTAENPWVDFSPPQDMAAFGRFAGALAARYGARGSFWAEHPDVPRRAIRTWQIWNEPAGISGFGSPSWAWDSKTDALKGYMAMLVAASEALRAADPHAQVMLSGLFGNSWTSLAELYAAGAGKYFDVVAIHPFTRDPSNVLRILSLVRGVMASNGDRDKALAVTELSWPAALNRVPAPFDFAVTERQQAANLTWAFARLARERRRLRLRSVYWYTWMSADASRTYSFDYAGLLTKRDEGRARRKPAFHAFRRIAHQLGGKPPRRELHPRRRSPAR